MLTSMAIFIGTLFQRPLILGNFEASIGLLIYSTAIVWMIFSGRNLINRRLLAVFLINILFLFVHSSTNVFFGGFDASIKVFVIGLTFNVCAVLAFSNYELNRLVAHLNIYLRIVIGSAIITVLLAGITAHGLESLSYLEVPIKDRPGMEGFLIYFPFSTIPYVMTIGGNALPRSTFLAIEPGVGVMIVLLWRVLEGQKGRARTFLLDAIFIGSLAATLSTTAPIIAFSYFYLRTFNSWQKIFSAHGMIWLALAGLAGLLVLVNVPIVGLADKTVTHGTAFTDRLDWYFAGAAVHRIIAAVMVALYCIIIIPRLTPSAMPLLAGMFVVSVLNVLAFTPLFFLCAYVTARVGGLTLDQIGSPKTSITKETATIPSTTSTPKAAKRR